MEEPPARIGGKTYMCTSMHISSTSTFIYVHFYVYFYVDFYCCEYLYVFFYLYSHFDFCFNFYLYVYLYVLFLVHVYFCFLHF